MKNQKDKKVRVQVNGLTFYISAYCFKKVGITNNMKFRVECVEEPDLGGEFDDYKSAIDRIGEFMFEKIIEILL